MAEKPTKIWNALNNFVPSSSSQNPSKNPSTKKRLKNPSKKSVQKSVQVCHFVIAIVPIGFVSARPVLKTSTSNLNIFMGSMAVPHEGCLQVYICSRDGQIEQKKCIAPRCCDNAGIGKPSFSVGSPGISTGSSVRVHWRQKVTRNGGLNMTYRLFLSF